jgi:hypothetical protein
MVLGPWSRTAKKPDWTGVFSHNILKSDISRSSLPNDKTLELSLIPQDDIALVGLIWLIYSFIIRAVSFAFS